MHLFQTPQYTIQDRNVHISVLNGLLTRYAKLRVAHAPGMPGTFSPPSLVIDPDMHHDTCLTHVPWCMSGSITSGFLWNRWRGKRSRHSRRMRNPQFCVSGKRPMVYCGVWDRCTLGFMWLFYTVGFGTGALWDLCDCSIHFEVTHRSNLQLPDL